MRFSRGRIYGDDIELNINLGGIGTVTIRKNYEVIQTGTSVGRTVTRKRACLSIGQ